LLLEAVTTADIPAHEVFLALGYRNLHTGFRALDRWVNHGEGHDSLLERIQASPYRIDPTILEAAWAENEALVAEDKRQEHARREEARRKAFRPHVRAITQFLSSSQARFFAMIGRSYRCIVFLPDDIAGRPLEEQERLVRESVRQNYARCGDEYFMDAILGYAYFPRYGEPPQRFTVTGDRDPSTEPFHPPGEARICCRNRPSRAADGAFTRLLIGSRRYPPRA